MQYEVGSLEKRFIRAGLSRTLLEKIWFRGEMPGGEKTKALWEELTEDIRIISDLRSLMAEENTVRVEIRRERGE